MTNTSIKRQKQITELLNDESLISKLKETDLACLIGYVQGLVANADSKNNEKETKK